MAHKVAENIEKEVVLIAALKLVAASRKRPTSCYTAMAI